MSPNKPELQAAVIAAAEAICNHAISLEDGNVMVSTSLANALGESLGGLAQYEEQEYESFLAPDQVGLNAAQVAVQRLTMPEDQLKVERIIDAADRLYLSIFDEVIVPGSQYRMLPAQEAKAIQYCPKSAIEDFRKAAG